MPFKETENSQIEKDLLVSEEKMIKYSLEKLHSFFRNLPLHSGKECFDLYVMVPMTEAWWKENLPQTKFYGLMVELTKRENSPKDQIVISKILRRYTSLTDDLEKITTEEWDGVFEYLRACVDRHSPNTLLGIKPFASIRNPLFWWIYFAVEIHRRRYTHEQVKQEFNLNPKYYPLRIREAWGAETCLVKGVYAIETVCRSFLFYNPRVSAKPEKPNRNKQIRLSAPCNICYKNGHSGRQCYKNKINKREKEAGISRSYVDLSIIQIGDVDIKILQAPPIRINLIGVEILKRIINKSPGLSIKYHTEKFLDVGMKEIDSNFFISTDICYNGRILKNETVYISSNPDEEVLLSRKTLKELGFKISRIKDREI